MIAILSPLRAFDFWMWNIFISGVILSSCVILQLIQKSFVLDLSFWSLPVAIPVTDTCSVWYSPKQALLYLIYPSSRYLSLILAVYGIHLTKVFWTWFILPVATPWIKSKSKKSISIGFPIGSRAGFALCISAITVPLDRVLKGVKYFLGWTLKLRFASFHLFSALTLHWEESFLIIFKDVNRFRHFKHPQVYAMSCNTLYIIFWDSKIHDSS